MPGYRVGAEYRPFFTESMKGVSRAIMGKRERKIEEQKNELAQNAWMGDPRAMQELAAMDPQLAMQVEDQSIQRKTATRQEQMAKDTAFKDDMEQVMDQIATFPDFVSAQSFGQRMIDLMAQKYPERWAQYGVPAEFTEEAFNEIKTIGGAGAMKAVGNPYQVEHPTTGEPATAVVVQDDKGNQYEKLMTGLEGGSLTRLSPLDVERKRQLAEAGAAGAALGKGAEARAQTAIDAGTAAAVQLPQINRSLALLDKISTSGLKEDINALAQYLGYEGDETADQAELQQLLAVQMFDTLANFRGAISEGELKTAKALSTGLGKNPEANKKILMALQQRLARAIDLARGAAIDRKDTIALQMLETFDPYNAAPYEGASAALPPAASKTPAPAAALQALQRDPTMIDQFESKYDYRPEGY